jgi:hypothetical protein
MTHLNKPAVFGGKGARLRTIRNGARFTVAHVLTCVVAGGVEAALAYEFFSGRIDMKTLIIGHAAVMAGLIAAIMWAAWRRKDLGLLSLTLTASLFTGPFGAVGCAILSPFLLSLRPSPEHLNAWYDRISGSIPRDPVNTLYEAIDSGRHSVEKFPSNRTFLDALQNGSWRQQQIVLGLVSRNFNDDFLPILTRSLKSPSAIMRTQAAAIANRLPRRYRDKIWTPVR